MSPYRIPLPPPAPCHRPDTWDRLLAPERVVLSVNHLLVCVCAAALGRVSVLGAITIAMALLWILERAREKRA